MGGCRAVTGEDEAGLAGPSAGGENALQGGTEGGIFKLAGDAQGDGEVEGAYENAVHPGQGGDGLDFSQGLRRFALGDEEGLLLK